MDAQLPTKPPNMRPNGPIPLHPARAAKIAEEASARVASRAAGVAARAERQAAKDAMLARARVEDERTPWDLTSQDIQTARRWHGGAYPTVRGVGLSQTSPSDLTITAPSWDPLSGATHMPVLVTNTAAGPVIAFPDGRKLCDNIGHALAGVVSCLRAHDAGRPGLPDGPLGDTASAALLPSSAATGSLDGAISPPSAPVKAKRAPNKPRSAAAIEACEAMRQRREATARDGRMVLRARGERWGRG
jgi:hypothetical protein